MSRFHFSQKNGVYKLRILNGSNVGEYHFDMDTLEFDISYYLSSVAINITDASKGLIIRYDSKKEALDDLRMLITEIEYYQFHICDNITF